MAKPRGIPIASHFAEGLYPPCPQLRLLSGAPFACPTAAELFLHDGFTSPVKSLTGAVKLLKHVEYYEPDSLVKILGPKHKLPVMNVEEQSSEDWTIGDWRDYWARPPSKRSKIYNVISLEVSHTPIESKIVTPEAVRQVDWIKHWPDALTRPETQPKGKSQYPKVQHYLLMGVQNCFTDFHIDFGGSSVWYHIARGRKIFLIVPPTKKNLATYEAWISSPKQDETFFASLLSPTSVYRVEIKAGETFFIPSGWIHAVFTPEDTIVVGGNFLHSFNIKNQLEVADIELRQKVPLRMRFPFFTATNWWVLYYYSQLIQTHITSRGKYVLNSWEREGLVRLLDWLEPHKMLANKALIEDGKAAYRPQFLLDYISSYLQNRPLPDEDVWKIKIPSIESPSPIKKQACTCGLFPDEDEETWIGCDYCGHWFHAKCIDPNETPEVLASAPYYYCKKCVAVVTMASEETTELLIHCMGMSLPQPPPLFQKLAASIVLLDSSSDGITSLNTSTMNSESSPTVIDPNAMKVEKTESKPLLTPTNSATSLNDSKKRKQPTSKPGGVYFNYGEMAQQNKRTKTNDFASNSGHNGPVMAQVVRVNSGSNLSRSGSGGAHSSSSNRDSRPRDAPRSQSKSSDYTSRSSDRDRDRDRDYSPPLREASSPLLTSPPLGSLLSPPLQVTPTTATSSYTQPTPQSIVETSKPVITQQAAAPVSTPAVAAAAAPPAAAAAIAPSQTKSFIPGPPAPPPPLAVLQQQQHAMILNQHATGRPTGLAVPPPAAPPAPMPQTVPFDPHMNAHPVHMHPPPHMAPHPGQQFYPPPHQYPPPPPPRQFEHPPPPPAYMPPHYLPQHYGHQPLPHLMPPPGYPPHHLPPPGHPPHHMPPPQAYYDWNMYPQ